MSLPNSNSYNNLGGELSDYSPVTDPTTDLSAEASNEMRSDVAAMTRTATRAWVSFQVSGTSIVVDSSDYDAVYGNANLYKPTGSYDAPGDYTITFPASIVDARSNTISVNIQAAWVNMQSSSPDMYFAKATVLSSNTVKVYLFDLNSGLTDPGNPATDKISLFVL